MDEDGFSRWLETAPEEGSGSLPEGTSAAEKRVPGRGVAVRGDLADEAESAKRAAGLAKKRNSFLDPATGWEYVIDEETGESSWVES